MRASFTVYVGLAEEHGTPHAVDVDALDTIGDLAKKAAKELQVDAKDITLYHEESELGELSEKVIATLLVEGSEVVARGTGARAVARKALRDLGLGWNKVKLLQVVNDSDKSDEEKAAVARLMIDAGVRFLKEPLLAASRRGYIETVKVLSVQSVCVRDAHFKDTPLHNAARHHHLPVVRHLVEAGAELEARDSLGLTPLMVMFDRRYLHPYASLHWEALHPVLQYLLEVGADVNARDKVGRTALHLACLNAPCSALPLVQLLVEAGANPMSLSDQGVSPFAEASKGSSWMVVKWLTSSIQE